MIIMAKEDEIQGIVRIVETDLDGNKKVLNALRQIKGISFTIAKAICAKAGINPNDKIGSFSERKVKKLEKIIKNPEESDFPNFLMNRRKDPDSGKNKHLVSGELEIQHKQDIDKIKKLGSYRGIRHRKGLPVRGQKTKSSFRGKKIVGVSKKRVKKGE